jgi:hypothetical protein
MQNNLLNTLLPSNFLTDILSIILKSLHANNKKKSTLQQFLEPITHTPWTINKEGYIQHKYFWKQDQGATSTMNYGRVKFLTVELKF